MTTGAGDGTVTAADVLDVLRTHGPSPTLRVVALLAGDADPVDVDALLAELAAAGDAIAERV